MSLHALAGKPVPPSLVVNIPRLVSEYFVTHPDLADRNQLVAFGTSGHRGVSHKGTFNEDHILAIAQATAEHRRAKGATGPLFLGIDTHALSEPACVTALEVFAANRVEVRIQRGHGYTPTPVISHAILTYNKGRASGLADGVVVTPSHNPPDNGGFKYNPPHGGPADTDETGVIETRANALLTGGNREVKRMPFAAALRAATTQEYDYIEPYVADLANVVDFDAVRASGIRIGVDPMGGAGLAFWEPIATRYRLDLRSSTRGSTPRSPS